jgi:hypothetical protein
MPSHQLATSIAATATRILDSLIQIRLLEAMRRATETGLTLFHQHWYIYLWRSTYDAAIVSIGGLLDLSEDSHSFKRIERNLRVELANPASEVALLAQLELATNRLQTPYLAFLEVRNGFVAHQSARAGIPNIGPHLDVLIRCISEMHCLLKKVAVAAEQSLPEYDENWLNSLEERFYQVLVSGMQSNLPSSVIHVPHASGA